jgi:hypothetical protein
MPVKVLQKDADKPIEKEILAEAILKVSDAMRKLSASGLNRDAIVALVKDASGITKKDINNILDTLVDLKALYCK